MRKFSGLCCGDITLHLITEENYESLRLQLAAFPDAADMLSELETSYRPQFNHQGERLIWGFYATLNGELAGMSLLEVDSENPVCGYTGADTLLHMRGRGIAPGSKPHLFHLGFAMLGLRRIETGCDLSNIASQRSIEKTPGFRFTGIQPGSEPNDDGVIEDVRYYVIEREEWERLYRDMVVEIIE